MLHKVYTEVPLFATFFYSIASLKFVRKYCANGSLNFPNYSLKCMEHVGYNLFLEFKLLNEVKFEAFYFAVPIGLGKQEQGINTCLQVEKTSKRGGKIINQDKG